MTRKKIIVITGPTASGKTALAISLARKLNTEIISADSRQCFTEMNIGVAKPSPEELALIKHYFVNSHSVYDHVNAGTFESYALAAVKDIFRNNDVAIMAGGTGLYIKAFCEGLDEIPAVPNNIRRQITAMYQQKGMDWLRTEVSVRDPLYFDAGEIQNPQRLMRALEVKLASGQSIKEFQRQQPAERDFDIIKYAVDIQRPQLNNNIDNRVNAMMEKGLAEEVYSLISNRHLNALHTVGYTELFEHFDGTIPLGTAVERIKINTRHYAKRQMTWFRKDPLINWIKDENQIKI